MQRFPHSWYSSPKGAQLPALERNILKYRAIQMTLCLFYAESIKSFILNTIYPAATKNDPRLKEEFESEHLLVGKLRRTLSNAIEEGTLTNAESTAILRLVEDRRKQGTKMKVAFADAVAKGVFSQEESEELQRLIDYRNDIAHRLQHLTADISPTQVAREMLEIIGTRYQYDALDRLRYYSEGLWERVRKNYVIMISMDGLLFEPVERAYTEELKRLGRIIQSQYAIRKQALDKLNAELSLEGTELVDDFDPRFPENRKSNGTLTERGAEICYRLFDLGKSPLAVAYIMGMTYKSALSRLQGWQKEGGRERRRVEIKRHSIERGFGRTAIAKQHDMQRSGNGKN